MLTCIILAILTFSFCQQPNLVAFKNSSYSTDLAINDIETILSNYNWTSFLGSSALWQYQDAGRVQTFYIKMNTFTFSNIDVDFTNSTTNIAANDIEITANVANLKVVINFQYTSKTGVFSNPSGTGVLILKPQSLFFTKREFKPTDGVHSVNGTINASFTYDAALTSGAIDSNLQKYLGFAVQANAPALVGSIASDLSNAVNLYYDTQSKVVSHNFPVETGSPDHNYNVALNFLSDPAYAGTGITYFYDGTVSKKTGENSGFLEEPSPNDVPSFDPKNGQLQIYINHQVINQILDDFGKSGDFSFTANSGNIPSSFQLNIDYLGQIIPGVYNSYTRDALVSVNATVNTIVPKDTNSKFGIANVDFAVWDTKSTAIFKWTTVVGYTYSVEFDKSNALQVKIITIDVLDNSITLNNFGAADSNILNTWVASSFQNFLEKENSWGLFKGAGVNLGTLFNSTNVFNDDDNGTLIGGDAAFQPSLEVFQRSFFNLFRK